LASVNFCSSTSTPP